MSEEQNISEGTNKDQIPISKEEEVSENISPPETIEQPEPETQNTKLQTENMEVHHHPQVEKKSFKEYLLEGLMIFIAVTMGFFAEQIREDFADRNREMEYMKSMVEDLKADTTSLSTSIRLRQQRDKMINSLVYLLSSPGIKQNGNDIYFFARSISPPIYFFPDDRTIQQLKSTGSLRLISNLQISNSIMDYDRKMRQQIFEYTDEQQDRAEYRQMATKIFDGKVFNEMISKNTIEKPVSNPQLFTSDAVLINEYIIETQYIRKANQNQVTRAEELFAQAKLLMELIKKQYHLE